MTALSPSHDAARDHQRPRRVAVVFNPSSGGDTAAERRELLRERLEAADVAYTWLETTPDEAGGRLAARAAAEGAELVIACGGDGTVMACATGLAGGDVPLAVLPLGTGNLVAANFDIPDDIDAALGIALECRRRRIDLGAVGADRFVIAAGMGFDAAMLRDADHRLKARLGPVAYVLSGLRNIRRPRALYELVLDDRPPLRRRGQGVIICNLGRIQGGLPLLPDAVPDDGLFDIGMLRTRTLRDWLVVAMSVLLRRHGRPPELEVFTAARVVVRASSPQPVQLDGDVRDSATELVLEIDAASLTLAVPAHHADRTPPERRHSD